MIEPLSNNSYNFSLTFKVQLELFRIVPLKLTVPRANSMLNFTSLPSVTLEDCQGIHLETFAPPKYPYTLDFLI